MSASKYASLTKSLVLTSLLSFLFITGCDVQMSDGKKDKDEKDKKEVVVPVRTTKVVRGPIMAFYPTTTTLEPEFEASVVAKVGGIVEKYYVEEGDFVKAGQPLVQIETDRLKLELARSNSNLKKMKSELDRTSAIYKKKLVSSETYERLKFEYESQKANYDLSQLELTFATVKAPIDGVISKRHVKVGNMIGQNAAVYHITDFDPLHAVIYVPEKELNKIAVNQVAYVHVDAKADKVFEGFVKRISPVVDANSGTFKVTVEVADKENHLKPGMFGRLQIIYDQRENSILIDKKAIITEDNQFWVFVVRDGRAYKQIIKPGYTNEQHFEVLEGLKDGDVVVNMGQNSLKNDSKIDVIDENGKSKSKPEEKPEEKQEEKQESETESDSGDQ